jgi:hypothetical protein
MSVVIQRCLYECHIAGMISARCVYKQTLEHLCRLDNEIMAGQHTDTALCSTGFR